MKPDQAAKQIIIGMPVLLLGGTELQVLSLVTILLRAGYKVTICCYYEFDLPIVDQMKEAGAEVILLKLKREKEKFSPKSALVLVWELFSIFRRYRPDIVHIQYLAPALIPIITARLARVHTVFATSHIAGGIAYGTKAKFLLRIAAYLCSAFFCVSKGVEEFWFGDSEVLNPEDLNNKRKHFTIYNAIDVETIEQSVSGVDREELKRSLGITGKKVVGIVGRLAPQKGHTILLDAVLEIMRKIPDVAFVVVGDGPERTSLEEKARKLNINQNILWIGSKQQKEVFELYSVMDMFVMPSLYEGFGLAAAEAMAAGLPVVGTRVDGLSEIIEDGVTGYILPVFDSHGLANVLIQMLSNPEKREMMGQRGKDRIRELFSLQRFNRSILAAYDDLSRH